MQIEEIHIRRFGGITDLSLTGLRTPLTVIIGPNEAGKSTALEFIRSMFFGFRKRSGRSAANTYETQDGAPRQGRLVVRDNQGERFYIERTERPGKKEGVVTIVDSQGHSQDPSTLPTLNRAMERSAYEALFAFDLDSMRELDREALRGKIIAAALGSLQVNPLDVVARVDEELKNLATRSSRNGNSLVALQARLDAVNGELRSIKDRPARYTNVKEELDRVLGTRREIAAKIPRKEAALANLKRILRHEEAWTRLLAAEDRLRELSDVSTFPPNGSALMDQALQRLRDARASEDVLIPELEELSRRFATIIPDEALLSSSDELRSLERRSRMLASRPSEIEALRLRVEQARRGILNDIYDLGKGWTAERVAACTISLATEQAVQRYVEAWRHSTETIVDLERRLGTAAESLDRLRDRIRTTQGEIAELEPVCRDFLGPHGRELVAKWKQCRLTAALQQEKLDDKTRLLERLTAERRELEQEHSAQEKELGRGPSTMVTAACAVGLSLFGLGSILLGTGAAGRVFPWADDLSSRFTGLSAGDSASLVAVAGAAAVLAGACLVAAYLIRKGRREVGLRHLDALDAKRSELMAEVARISRERTVIDTLLNEARRRISKSAKELLGRVDVPLEDVLQPERRSREAEEHIRKREIAQNSLTTDLAEAERQGRAAREIEIFLKHTHDEFGLLETRWRSFLRRNGLIEGPDPESARELIRRLAALKKDMREISDDEDVLTRLQVEWNEFAADIDAFAAEINRDAGIPLDAVAQWVAEANRARELAIEKQSIRERITDLKTRLERERKRIEEAEASISALLEQAGASEETEFRRQAARSEEFRRLMNERGVLVAGLVAGLRSADRESMRALMAAQDWQANEQLSAELESEIDQLRKESEELAHHAGRLAREAEEMESERQTERRLAEKEELAARLKEGVRRWIVLKLASQLLNRALDKCEREKQPKVMERSTDIFREITGSAFVAVRFPMEGDAIRTARSDGSVIEESLLSRGTLEQVYLSMRLAHLEVHHRGDSGFPLVMDDILVNFDEDRAARTARVLADFADETGIQVLFFTCHAHTAELFPDRVSRLYLVSQEKP